MEPFTIKYTADGACIVVGPGLRTDPMPRSDASLLQVRLNGAYSAGFARRRVSDRTESPEPASGEDLEEERGPKGDAQKH